MTYEIQNVDLAKGHDPTTLSLQRIRHIDQPDTMRLFHGDQPLGSVITERTPSGIMVRVERAS